MRMRVVHVAEQIMRDAAGTERYSELRTARTLAKSASAFVFWVRRCRCEKDVMRRAYQLQAVWKRLGLARVATVTLRALKAALLAVVQAAGRITSFLAERVVGMLQALRKPRAAANESLARPVQLELPLAA